jgi:putative oxidoreductase
MNMTARNDSTDRPRSKALHIVLWLAQGLLAVAFAMAGSMKIGMPIDELVANGMTFAARLPEGLVRFIGAAEILGAVGLMMPAATRVLPRLTPIAAADLAFVMVLAAGHHLINGEASMVPANALLGSLALFVAWGRWFRAPIQARGARAVARARVRT